MMPVNDDILRSNIRHDVELRRFSNATVRKIIALLGRSADRIATELFKRDIGGTTFTDRRLKLLLEAVLRLNGEAMDRFQDVLTGDMRELAEYEVEFQTDLFKRAIPVVLDVVTPSRGQLWAAVNAKPFEGRFLREYFRDLEQSTFKRLRNEIRMGYLEGRTTDQIIRSVRGTSTNRFKDGIIEANKRFTTTVVRTALNHTANVARETHYTANSDLVKGVQWVSTLDGRTSAVCRGRDGQVYEPNKGPRPPAHLNCRSTTTPVLKSWKELGISLKEAPEGTRASMNGQVPAKMTYGEWLRTQDKTDRKFVDEVLGPTKAKLWRDGDLTLDRFIDMSGNEYTIDELRRRERGAFESAGLI